MSILTHGLHSRRAAAPRERIPPGQSLAMDFPIRSLGSTPRTSLEGWDFSIVGEVGRPQRWSWAEFRGLPYEDITCDIHCVSGWSKLDTRWRGVSLDTLFDEVRPSAGFAVQFADHGYTTNLPLHDLTGGKAWVVFEYNGAPLSPQHGGPARMLVPHLYFWKSAKWVRGIRLYPTDKPGSREMNGYHNYGDPWREQRYSRG